LDVLLLDEIFSVGDSAAFMLKSYDKMNPNHKAGGNRNFGLQIWMISCVYATGVCGSKKEI